MKSFVLNWGHVMIAFALAMATITANTACVYCYHQPKTPDTIRKLRKF